jgi:hypothetical protein
MRSHKFIHKYRILPGKKIRYDDDLSGVIIPGSITSVTTTYVMDKDGIVDRRYTRMTAKCGERIADVGTEELVYLESGYTDRQEDVVGYTQPSLGEVNEHGETVLRVVFKVTVKKNWKTRVSGFYYAITSGGLIRRREFNLEQEDNGI